MEVETVDLIPGEIDVDEFLARMPENLTADLVRGYGGGIRAALIASMEYPSEDKKAVMLDGKPVVLFGAAKIESGPAELWKVESGGFERIKTSYMRILYRYSELWGPKYGAFQGFINGEFEKMLRFMEWGGWRLTPLGPEFHNYVEVYKSWASR